MFHTIQSEILRPDMALYTDIVYANVFNDWRRYNIPLKLNLMRPYGRFRFEERLPLLVWAEGGAWKSSAPASRLPELAYYAYHGFAVANVQYRVSTQSIWPAQIQDLKAAIRYLKVHADELGIDPERIVVAGPVPDKGVGECLRRGPGCNLLVLPWGYDGSDPEPRRCGSSAARLPAAQRLRKPLPGQDEGAQPHHLRHIGCPALPLPPRRSGRCGTPRVCPAAA